MILIAGGCGFVFWYYFLRGYALTGPVKEFVFRLQADAVFRLRVMVIGLSVALAAVILMALRRVWIPHAVRICRQLASIARRIFLAIRERLRNWFRRFFASEPREQFRMIRIPFCLMIATVGIFLFGKYVIPPTITATFPDSGSTDAPLATRIEFIFSRNVIRQTAELGFAISPKVPGTFEWESGQKLVFVPKIPLSRSTKYTAGFRTPVLGANLMPVIFKTTIEFETLGDPAVVLSSPTTEALEDLAPVTVVFDRPMIPLTTATNSALNAPAFTIDPPIAGEGRWLGTTAYQYRPSERFRRSTTYTVTVPAGLASQDGGSLKNGYIWSFSSERPRVIDTSPLNGYDYASPVASVAAIFSQPIDPASANSHFSVFDEKNNRVAGSIVIVKDLMVGFYPLQPLIREKTYRAVVDAGIAGKEGPNGMENPYEWNFTVSPLPAIISTKPAQGEHNAGEDNYVWVDFRTPMDETSFKNNYSISPQPDIKPTYYFSSYNGQNRLSIGTYLGRSKTYTVTVSGSVKDQYGTPLGRPYSFTFDTAPYKPAVSIIPGGTYFAAFNQAIIPRIVVQVTNTRQVNYELFRLKRADFFDLYNRRYGSACQGKSGKAYDDCSRWLDYGTSKLEKIRTWSETFDSGDNTPVSVVTKAGSPDGGYLSSGLYYLKAAIPQGPFDTMVMIVTKSALTVKRSQNQILVWATDQTNGTVVGDMKISLVNQFDGKLAEGQTNADGVWKQPVDLHNRGDTLFAYGEKAGDITVAATAWSEGINRYDFGLPSYYDPNQYTDYQNRVQYKQYMVFDRPIYRPGQKVYFKGVIRKDNDGAYETVGAGEKITIKVTDERNRDVYSTSLPLTSFGSYSGEFDIGRDAALGTFTVNADYNGSHYGGSIQVEEYKKPEHAVTVTPAKTSYVAGETPQFTISAAYYYGAPVADAPLIWYASAYDYSFRWDKDTRFEFGDTESYWNSWWESNRSATEDKSTSGKGRTDSRGEYAVSVPLDFSTYKTSQQLTLEATVNDLNNQNVAASGLVVVHKANVYVGVHPESYANQAGREASIELVTVDPAGKELSGTDVAVDFYKRTWNTVREQDPDTGEYFYASKATDTYIESKTATTDGLGRATIRFTPPTGGTVKMVAKARDGKGNENTTVSFLWVWGDGFEAPRQNNDRIILVTDKKDYTVGEDLSLFVASPFASQSATTLLTMERGNVIDYRVTRTGADSNNFRMPVTAAYSPNIFLGAVLVKPGDQVKNPPEFKIGYAEVKVTDPAKKLDVSITTDKKRYKPRETLSASIETKDASGKPVAAEVAVGLVDKAVWDLAMTEMPEIYKTFYLPRNLDVDTSQLLTISMDRINANTNLGSKGGSGGGCFTGDTLILMPGGVTKPIRDMRAGDMILTRDTEETDRLAEDTVTAVDKHTVDEYLVINGELDVTPVHVLFVNGEWKVAGAIETGDSLSDASGHPIRVYSVERVFRKTDVYNLRIQKRHTFIAGGFYVHNDKGGYSDTSRYNFPDTAYWKPHLMTGGNGKLSVQIPLPDSLTTWKLSAIANSDKAAFGSNSLETIVSRDVLIRPFLPRFMATGDTARIGGIIANTSGGDRTVTVTLKVQGLDLHQGADQSITLADGAQKKVLWQAEAGPEGNASVNIQVRGTDGKELDAVTNTFPVTAYSIPETVATSGEIKGTARETIYLPADVDKTRGSLDVTLSPSLGLDGLSAIRSLLDYPYFCVEQITSKLLPSIYVHRVIGLAGLGTSFGTTKPELERVISDGIQRLNQMQHPDGGWGWWMDSQSNAFLTAYAVLGLTEAKKSGFTVDGSVLSRGKEYLMTSLSAKTDYRSPDRDAYILYVISRTDTAKLASYASGLFDQRFKMTLEGRGYLDMVMDAIGGMGEQTKRLRDELVSLSKKTATSVHWEEKEREYWFMGSNTTTTAVILEMLMRSNANHPFIAEGVRYLASAKHDSHWLSTKDTAAVMRSLVTLFEVKKGYDLDATYQIKFNGSGIKDGTLTKKDLVNLVLASVPVPQIPTGQNNTLEMAKSGKGNLYYSMNLRYSLPFTEITPLEQGMVVMREYVDGKGKPLPPDSMPENTEEWVRLTVVAPEERHYVILEDPLPAGLEAVNESLKTTRKLGVEKPDAKNRNRYGFDPSQWYFNHIEYHDDKVAMFAEYLPAGVYELMYRVRSTVPGTFHHLPAQSYQMYVPDVSGHSEGGWYTVTPKTD